MSRPPQVQEEGSLSPSISPTQASYLDDGGSSHVASSATVLTLFVLVAAAAVLVGVYTQKKKEWQRRRVGAGIIANTDASYREHHDASSSNAESVEMSSIVSAQKQAKDKIKRVLESASGALKTQGAALSKNTSRSAATLKEGTAGARLIDQDVENDG